MAIPSGLTSKIIFEIVKRASGKAWKSLTRKEKVLKILDAVGIKPGKPDPNFESVYAHTLVEYGIEQPEPILNFFRHEDIRRAFQISFEKNDYSILNNEAASLVNWSRIGDELRDIDLDPRLEFARFTLVFNEMVDYTRAPAEVVRDHKIDRIDNRVQELVKWSRDLDLETIRAKHLETRQKTFSGSRRAYKVFVSSTYRDNEERRKAVKDAITMAGMVWHGMEIFTGSTRPTKEECLRFVKEADLLVGIIAWRYGWEPDGKKSITEMEYDAAKERLMFQLDPSLPINPQEAYDPGPDKWEKQKKLDAFKEQFSKDQMTAYFTETT